ncbi:PrsW family intramembrane metalloprotease [Lignipirellula cremea]|nr:PrsW family glutamic-type intramembrane protease [Lignipirellula cremea]
MLYLGVIVCAALLAAMVYRYDLYDREPVLLLALAFAGGYGLMYSLGFLEDYSLDLLSIGYDDFAGQAMVASTHEEIAKMILVVLIAFIFRRHFNDPMDGLVYGSFVGLGAGLCESVFYLSLVSDPSPFLIGTEAVRLILHLLFGGLTGFGVGAACLQFKAWPAFLIAWVAASMTLHFCWDYWLGIPIANGMEPPVDPRITAVILMLGAIGAFALTIILGSSWSRAKFAPDSQHSVWGWPFC